MNLPKRIQIDGYIPFYVKRNKDGGIIANSSWLKTLLNIDSPSLNGLYLSHIYSKFLFNERRL